MSYQILTAMIMKKFPFEMCTVSIKFHSLIFSMNYRFFMMPISIVKCLHVS